MYHFNLSNKSTTLPTPVFAPPTTAIPSVEPPDNADYRYLISARYSTVVLFVCSFYLCIALLIYEVKTMHTKRPAVNHLLSFSAFAAWINCLSQILELFVSVHCHVYRWTNAVSYVLGSAAIYSVIWDRQRNFYRNPLLKNAAPALVRFLSQWIIVGIYAVLIGLVVVFVVNYTFKPTEYGCIVQWTEKRLRTVTLPVLMAMVVISTGVQITLLILVVYPLHMNETKPSGSPSVPASHKRKSYKRKSDIRNLVHRLSVSTLACVLSTIAFNFLISSTVQCLIKVFWSNFIAADLLFNTVATLCSFVNWRRRLFPFYSFANTGSEKKSTVSSQCACAESSWKQSIKN